MAERVKDDDVREIEKAKQRSAEVKAALEAAKRQKEKAEAEARARARVQGPQPKPAPVQGPQPRPQSPVPENFEPLRAWKKAETPEEKAKSWGPQRPQPKEETRSAFDQWVDFKQKESKTFLPQIGVPKSETPPVERPQPKPLQLAKPTIDTSAPPLSASGTVGGQTQTVRQPPAPSAPPDVLRGQYEQPERRTFDEPERSATMGVPTRPLPNILNMTEGMNDFGVPANPVPWKDFGRWLVENSANPNPKPVEDQSLAQMIVPERSPFQDGAEAGVDAYVKWYQESGAEAFRQSKSDRRWDMANMSAEEQRQRAAEIAENAQGIVDTNPAQALLGGGEGNTLLEGWQMQRPNLDWFGNLVADAGSAFMDGFDAVQAQTSAFITQPTRDGGMSPGMVIGGLADQTRDQLNVNDDDPDNDMPVWANAIAAPLLYAGNALYGALGLDPTDATSLEQRVQEGIQLVDKIRSLPEDQRKEAVAAVPNLISGVTNAQQTADFILTRKEEAAKLRQQAEYAKAQSLNPAMMPEQRQQAALDAAQLGAQANALDKLYIADIVEMHQDPVMEFAVGALLDPLNFLDFPLGIAGDMIRAGRVAKRIGLGVGDVVSNADAIKHIDNAIAQADELLQQVATNGSVDIRALKGRPAAEKASKGITSLFGKTKETLVQARTEQVFNVLSAIIPPNISASDAKIILTTLVDNPRALIDGLPANMFTSSVLTDTLNVNGLVKWGNGVVAPKFLSEYYPILKAARDDLLNMLPLQHTGALDAPQFIAAVDDIVMDTSRRLYGMSKLPTDVPLGTSKIEVRRAPTPRGQPRSQDGVLIYKDSHGNELGRSNPMPMAQAKTQRTDLEKAALAAGTTGGARIASAFGNVLTLRPILTDLYLGLRPANWVKNAASAYAVMFADGMGSFRPLTEIENYLTTKMGDLMGNQRVAQGIAGSGTLKTQFGEVDRAHWLEKVWKNNPYSKVVKKSLEIPYSNTGIKVGNIEFPVGEQNFYARIFQSAFERTFNPAIENVTRRLLAPMLQQGLDPTTAKHVADYLNHVGRTGSKTDYVTAAKRLFGGAPPVGAAPIPTPPIAPTAGDVAAPVRPGVPPSPAVYGVPNGVLTPQTERTVMQAIASGDMDAVDAAMAAELKKHTSVLQQAPPQAGVAVSTETAIINEAEDIEDMARIVGQDASDLVSRFVQARQAAYQPLLNDLATTSSTVEAADIITAFMGANRQHQEQFWQRIDDINRMAVDATGASLGGTNAIHVQRWQQIEAAVENYLRGYQSLVQGFRARLASGNIEYDLVTGRNIFDKLTGTPDLARPVVSDALEYGTSQYAAVIAANKAALDRAYVAMWDAARRNPSMLALDTMLAADDRVGDIYRMLAADTEEYKAWLRGLGPDDNSPEWEKFRSERDQAYAEYHNIAASVYDSARASIVAQAVAETTYKARGGTYKIISNTGNGWRIQKLGRDGAPTNAPILSVQAGDALAPPRAIARKWQEAQAEILSPPAPKQSAVVDDRLPINAPVAQTTPVEQGGIPDTPDSPPPANPDKRLASLPLPPGGLREQVSAISGSQQVAAHDAFLRGLPNRGDIVETKNYGQGEVVRRFNYGGNSGRGMASKYQYLVQTADGRTHRMGENGIVSVITYADEARNPATWNAPAPVSTPVADTPQVAPAIATVPQATRPTNELYAAAQRAGITTATKSGAPMDRHLLNSINKHAGEIGLDRKIARLDDLTPDEMQRAIAYYEGRTNPAKKATTPSASASPSSSGAVGNKTQAWSDPNKPVDVQYEVLEYDDLIVSNLGGGQVNPRYPAELQPRDRTQAASRMQVDTIAQNLQPRELLSTTDAIDRGSPIINADNVVESGNGRIKALGISPKYDEYKAYLIENASQYGIDPALIQGMNRPVLVRRRLSGEDSVTFAQSANARQTLSMNAIEQGRVLASRVSPQVLSRYFESGGTLANINTVAGNDFARSIIGMLPANERAAYLSPSGALTTQGTEFVRSVLFATVFKDDSVLRNYVLAVDPDLRNIGNAFESAIVDLAVLEKTLPDLAIGQELSDAANTLIQLRSSGTSVDEFLAQGAMFDSRSPEFVALLRYMNDNIRSGTRIGSALRDYARRAAEYNPAQASMFAGAAPAGKLDLLERALQTGTPPQSLFSGFGFVPPDDWFTGWHQLTQRGRNNMGQTAPQMGAAASHMAQQVTNAWLAFRRGAAPLPSLNLSTAQQMAALDSINDVAKMWDDAIVYSQQMANKAADYAMLNFNDRRNFDTLLSMVMPYHYFWSRSMLNWTKRLARKPSLLNFYFEVERDRARTDRMNQVENQGLPARVGGRFPVLGDWFVSNPFNLFLPVNSYLSNEFVDPTLANNRWERWYMQGKQWTPIGGITMDMGMAQLFDMLYPRGEGAQPRTAEFGVGDYAPLVRQGTSIYQGMTGNIPPSWLSGDPYAYGTSGRAAATNLDIDPNLRKWALDVGTQLLKGLPPLPEQPEEAEAIWTAAVKQAGWEDWQAKAMAFVLGLPFAKVSQDERTMRQNRNTRRGLGYAAGENATGSKAAVDLFDEQTGDAATLLAQYTELYPQNSASNPDSIDYGRPGLNAARDMRGVELDALDKQREAEINAYIQKNWGKETSDIYDGINAINAKYDKQEAAIKGQYPSVEDGGFKPTQSYYRHHSPEELQAAAETAAKFAAQAQVGARPTPPGEGASSAEWQAYYTARDAYDQAYQNALAAILADPTKLSGGVAGMPTTTPDDPQARAEQIIADRSYQPLQQQRLGERSKQESAAKAAERAEVFEQFGENIYDLQDQYFALPEGSQARRDFLDANPQLKQYWDWRRKQDGKASSTKGLKGSASNEEYAAKRAEAETLFGPDIWDVVDGYDKDWSQEEKRAYFAEHPELLAFWDFWYGESESTQRSASTRRPFMRTGFPGVTGSRFYIPRRPSATPPAGNVGFPDPSDMYDPRWAQYQQQAQAQPGNWRPSNRREGLRDIPLATLRTWA